MIINRGCFSLPIVDEHGHYVLYYKKLKHIKWVTCHAMSESRIV